MELDTGNQGEKIKSIRYALTAIRNVGHTAIETIIDERKNNGEFSSIDDFINRVNPNSINKRQLESLIKAGAMDALNSNRRQLFNSVESILRHVNLAHQERESPQIKLFKDKQKTLIDLKFINISDWDLLEKLKQEFDALGFYFSAHPLDIYLTTLKKLNVQTILETQRLDFAVGVDSSAAR